MKYLKPWWSDGGSLLHLTILLSLAGLHLDLDLDLYLLLPGGLTSLAYELSSFPASGRWGHAELLHPKGRERDTAAPPEGRLLREVRALGVPFIPCTRVDAWLVHSVAAGNADGTHALLGAAAASSAGGVGAGVNVSQAAPGGGGDPRAAPSSPLAAGEEEKAPAEPTAQVSDAGGYACERHRNGTDTSFSLEDLLQLLSSQPENPLEGISLRDSPPLPGTVSDGMNSPIRYNVNFSHAISQDVNLHEAMLLCPDDTFRRDPVARASLQESFLQLSSPVTNSEQTLPGTNLTGFLPFVDNQMRNLTGQDLYDLDINIFDDINLMSLGTEGFDSTEVSQLFEETDSDSGLSLNSSHNSTSVTKSNSSHSVCEGATGSNSDLESLSHHDLEGAVGGYYPEPSKLCHLDHRNDSNFHGDLAFQHILHNHTYHLQPSALESTSESFSWPEKSQKTSRYLNDTDQHLSRDERRAKALHIPFTVDEIVCMPVDSFNSMLSRHYLTDFQVSLIRDIRRRGKNKVAAQNCRKRKLDIISNLEDDVCNLQAKKETLESERSQCHKAINIMKQKLHDLYHDVFSRLRDDEGRPVNPNQYAIQCSHDGSVLIVPKELVTPGQKKKNQKGKQKSERRN
ncbi:nuclear factor erythroid 2-related factor 3 isoform X2 [Hippopotamus amphibius kiboko]|uniref:nuclear factor erythroid 2-related factor 3 isoform X2 n=1 Tax=Hippopotamus amphibius kiboko TaxID=575201 RepID=UPI002591E4AD|nr:nuclear factor erythroid 2-related factor 3 isoform X2 [Hippopotamus amphibius kiboko]